MKKLIAVGLLAVSASAGAVEYNVAILDSLSGSGNTGAFGMNESGQVVGYSYNSVEARNEAVIWNNGVVQSLGVEGLARAVNNSGTVVGETGTDTLNDVTLDGRAFKWDAGNGYVDLGDLGGSFSGARDINEAGVITGGSYVDDSFGAIFFIRAFRWENGVMTDLGTTGSPTGYTRANAINDAGQIAGRGSIVDFLNSDKHRVVWDAANNITQTIGPFGYSNAGDINNAGVIAGNIADANGDQRAAIFDGGSTTIFGTLGQDASYLEAINEAGVAVGRTELDDNNLATNKAIILLDGDIVDLNTLVNLDGTGFSSLNEAWDINDNGEIVGVGTLAGGGEGAFLISVIPIPPAVWLFGSALGAVGWLRRRVQ